MTLLVLLVDMIAPQANSSPDQLATRIRELDASELLATETTEDLVSDLCLQVVQPECNAY